MYAIDLSIEVFIKEISITLNSYLWFQEPLIDSGRRERRVEQKTKL